MSSNKMNPEYKKKWVDALRSGEYSQGVGSLCVGGNYCCLGVLCEVTGTSKVIKFDHHIYDGQVGYLPDSVRTLSGLGSANPFVMYKGKERSLAYLNDEGLSFNEIADLIEEQL